MMVYRQKRQELSLFVDPTLPTSTSSPSSSFVPSWFSTFLLLSSWTILIISPEIGPFSDHIIWASLLHFGLNMILMPKGR